MFWALSDLWGRTRHAKIGNTSTFFPNRPSSLCLLYHDKRLVFNKHFFKFTKLSRYLINYTVLSTHEVKNSSCHQSIAKIGLRRDEQRMGTVLFWTHQTLQWVLSHFAVKRGKTQTEEVFFPKNNENQCFLRLGNTILIITVVLLMSWIISASHCIARAPVFGHSIPFNVVRSWKKILIKLLEPEE